MERPIILEPGSQAALASFTERQVSPYPQAWTPPSYQARNIAQIYSVEMQARAEIQDHNQANRAKMPPREKARLEAIERGLSAVLGRCGWILPEAQDTQLSFALFHLRGPIFHNPKDDPAWTRQALFDQTGECLLTPPTDFTPTINQLMAPAEHYYGLKRDSYKAHDLTLLAEFLPNGHVAYFLAEYHLGAPSMIPRQARIGYGVNRPTISQRRAVN